MVLPLFPIMDDSKSMITSVAGGTFVGGRLSGACCGPPTAFPVGGTGVPWVSLPGPTGVPQSFFQGDSVAKRQPFLSVVVGVVGIVTSCVPCARVPRVSRDVITTFCSSCATENTYKFIVSDLVVIQAGRRHSEQVFCCFVR